MRMLFATHVLHGRLVTGQLVVIRGHLVLRSRHIFCAFRALLDVSRYSFAPGGESSAEASSRPMSSTNGTPWAVKKVLKPWSRGNRGGIGWLESNVGRWWRSVVLHQKERLRNCPSEACKFLEGRKGTTKKVWPKARMASSQSVRNLRGFSYARINVARELLHGRNIFFQTFAWMLYVGVQFASDRVVVVYR
ncbi:hypothetical protein MTO96_006082 [Rhipicephalus appendiculatus]